MNEQPQTATFSRFQCPRCGRWSDDDMTLIERTEANDFLDSVSGMYGLEWTEKHVCPDCEVEWTFRNANL